MTSTFFPYKCMGRKKVEGQHAIFILIFLSSRCCIQIFSLKVFLAPGKKVFKSFYHIWHGSHFVQWRGIFRTNCQYHFDRKPNMKPGETCSSDFGEEDIKKQDFDSGGDLGFPIGTIQAIFYLEVILLLQYTFQLKSPNGSGG